MNKFSLIIESFLKRTFRVEKEIEPFFWEKKTLSEMTNAEWEMLCDGCGKCCLYKIDNEDGTKTLFTDIACRLLDTERCSCKLYKYRQEVVSDCLKITMEDLAKNPRWVPKTCAYYLLYTGQKLKDWHPLISGNKESVHEAKVSTRGRVISENDTDDALEDHIVDWDDI
ncbi:MAG: YcgN family cysteine cluster protein [Alphaproteobacteria bacterium]